ncbi:MAG: MoxR family ATPase [Desulfarculus sp.]|jgi:MoxR-like ATPase|nr:MAG: MoxR family ATPase [Desulfarculus sp.]
MRVNLESVKDVAELMGRQDYVCDPELALIVFLALKMEKPLFLEGAAGVGKTEVAKALAQGLGYRLIRLQCYEGLDVNTSLYEWNYSKQLLEIKRREVQRCAPEALGDIFSEEFLVKRPLLQAIQSESQGEPVVLLIDELDRADEEFEAFLLELLSDFQVTIPEIGTLRAKDIPVVVISSNRSREVHEATKRRCLYHWIDYPSIEKESQILKTKVPGIGGLLTEEICRFMHRVRQEGFLKTPGVAETLDWAEALILLHRDHLDERTVLETRGCLFKHRQDQQRFLDGCNTFLSAL